MGLLDRVPRLCPGGFYPPDILPDPEGQFIGSRFWFTLALGNFLAILYLTTVEFITYLS